VTVPVGAGTRLVALLGDPVAHSLSPRMQNAAFRAADLDAVYLALRCTGETLPGLMRGIALAGGAGNVTVPHKEAAARCLELPTAAVRETGACNTFWLEEGRLAGDNTDVAGFLAAVQPLLDGAGGRWLLLGAGGGARAVIAAAAALGVEEVVVWNRTPGRAVRLADATVRDAPRVRAMPAGEAPRGAGFDLVVNATSLGLGDQDPLPLEVEACRGAGAAFDLVYREGGTAWTRAVSAAGIPALDGAGMLVAQGAEAFRRWWGSEPPVEAMRRALAG
jgi:shikimate dehydrogenase